MAIHIGGLVSGNDYQAMVDQLLKVKRIPIESKQTELDELDYDMGAWTNLNNLAADLTSSLNTLRGYELWRDMSVNSTDPTTVTASAATASAEQDYSIIVSNLASSQSISSDVVDTSADLITQGYANEGDIIEIEGQQITFEAGETLTSLRNKINTAAEEMDEALRVRASIVDNHLVLTREQTGLGSINISDVSGLALENMGVLNGGLIKNEDREGLDANFSVNGISVSRSKNTELNDVIEGITLTLRDAGASTLSVRPDRDAVKAAVLDFVEKYNTFSEQVDSYSGIALGSSSSLAQKGELYGDSLLNSIERRIREYATDVKHPTLNHINATYNDHGVSSIMDSLNDIGIWTSGEANRLELLDEEQLDEQLEYNFTLIEQLFKGVYDSQEVAYVGGVASDFYSYMRRISESLTGDIAVQIENQTKKYDDLADEIETLEDALADYEQEQWEYFTKMEDALAEMQSQLDYISSMFFSSTK